MSRRELTLEQAEARVDALAGMKDTLGWVYFEEELEAKLADVERKILAGELDAVQYANYCGVRKGLRAALQLPDRMIGNAPEEESRHE